MMPTYPNRIDSMNHAVREREGQRRREREREREIERVKKTESHEQAGRKQTEEIK